MGTYLYTYYVRSNVTNVTIIFTFVNGINSSLINLVKQIFEENQNEDNSEVFLIYIKENKFKLGSTLININKKKYKYLQDNVPALPTQMEKELKNKLKIIKGELDSYIKANHNKNVYDYNTGILVLLCFSDTAFLF